VSSLHCNPGEAYKCVITASWESGPGTTHLCIFEIFIWSILIHTFADGYYFENSVSGLHRWASTLILMSAISDIRHRHLLFGYRRKICRTENCRFVPISTSESILLSDIYKKLIFTSWIRIHDPKNRQ
jgi:hypothetical protein